MLKAIWLSLTVDISDGGVVEEERSVNQKGIPIHHRSGVWVTLAHRAFRSERRIGPPGHAVRRWHRPEVSASCIAGERLA